MAKGYRICYLPVILAFLTLLALGSDLKKSSTATIRIGVVGFAHETCTFRPTPTGVAESEYHGPPRKGAEVLEAPPHIRGFVENGISGAVIEIDGPGVGPADLSQIPYQNIPEIYPLAGSAWYPGGKTRPEKNFSKEELVAWCIVPFDALQRGPEERAKMLRDLGITKLAYDWRDKDIPTFDAELTALGNHGIDLHAFWCPIRTLHPLSEEPVRVILELLKRRKVNTQLWVSLDESQLEGLKDEDRVEVTSKAIRELALEAHNIGSVVGLYNHGGWFGNPRNQIAIIKKLKMRNVGIVFNFHHGHEYLGEFSSLFLEMQPYLMTVNLNGMKAEGPKILPLGSGDQESAMIRVMVESGYSGPVGILDHQSEQDSRKVLEDNLRGLKIILDKLED